MSFLWPPKDAQVIAPKLVDEQRKWVEADLILPFGNNTLAEDVVVEILARIRKHIEVGEVGWDEERKERMRS
jgi:hypothetical protein